MTSVLWESITTLKTPQETRSSYYSRDPPQGASLFDTEEIVAFDTFCSYEDGDANKQTTIIDTKVQCLQSLSLQPVKQIQRNQSFY